MAKLIDILAVELKEWPPQWGEFCVCTSVEVSSWGAWFNSRRQHMHKGWNDLGSVEYYLSEEPEDRRTSVVTRAEWEVAVEALKKPKLTQFVQVTVGPEWSGEGPPPVGTVCDLQHSTWSEIHWEKRKILYLGDVYLITSDPDSDEEKSSYVKEMKFRPIRTPEQIAAEERLHKVRNACTNIAKDLERYNVSIDCSAAMRAAIEAMIDAGYRLPEVSQ